VHITELGSDYFQFDDARHELRGERTGKRYQLTDRVRVQVSRVDLDARKIDLAIVQTPSVRDGQVIDRERLGGSDRGKMKSDSAGNTPPKAFKGSIKSSSQRAVKEEVVAAPVKSRSGKTEAVAVRSERATRVPRSGKKKR
jgi:ribonuclease R